MPPGGRRHMTGPMVDNKHIPMGVRDFYRRSAAYQRHLAAKDMRHFEPYVRFVRRYVPAGAALLDLGCGNGLSAAYLGQAGFRVTGCDLRIQSAAGRGPAAALCEGDGLALPFRDGTFDAVCASSYLEHVPDPATALAEMVRVCRRGGRVLIDGPNHLSPVHPAKAIIPRLLGQKAPPTPYGSTVTSISLTAARVLRWGCEKAVTRRCRFIQRRPDLGHPEAGGDLDALWWSNPADIRWWFREHGHRVIASQTEGRTRWLADWAAGAQVVAEVAGRR